jgi:hypothetical protein
MTRRPWYAITIASFGLGLGTYVAIDEIVSDQASTFFKVLAAIGIYTLIFRAFVAIVRRVYPRVFTTTNLGGVWWQLFHIDDSHSRSSARFGPCSIVVDVDWVVFHAHSYRENGSFSSTWQSDAVVVRDRQISLMFTSESATARRGPTHGTMEFGIHSSRASRWRRSRPSRLVGHFADATPATNGGEITLYRSREEFLRVLRALDEDLLTVVPAP